jgi:hypothetical protein
VLKRKSLGQKRLKHLCLHQKNDNRGSTKSSLKPSPRLAMDIRPAGAATVCLIALERLFSFNDLACAA